MQKGCFITVMNYKKLEENSILGGKCLLDVDKMLCMLIIMC